MSWDTQGQGHRGTAQEGRGRAPAEGDYLASWALLLGLGGAESPPAPAGPWLRASEGTLRVLRREEELQEHGTEGAARTWFSVKKQQASEKYLTTQNVGLKKKNHT